MQILRCDFRICFACNRQRNKIPVLVTFIPKNRTRITIHWGKLIFLDQNYIAGLNCLGLKSINHFCIQDFNALHTTKIFWGRNVLNWILEYFHFFLKALRCPLFCRYWVEYFLLRLLFSALRSAITFSQSERDCCKERFRLFKIFLPGLL